jgi:hypothetical protein
VEVLEEWMQYALQQHADSSELLLQQLHEAIQSKQWAAWVEGARHAQLSLRHSLLHTAAELDDLDSRIEYLRNAAEELELCENVDDVRVRARTTS